MKIRAFRNNMGMIHALRHGVLLVVMLLGVQALAAPYADDQVIYGTNVWKGATSGGDWNDADNWTPLSAGGLTAAELLTKNCVYDFSTLENGAVVTNNTEDLKVSGIITRSSSSQGTITFTGKSALLMGQTEFRILHADTIAVWQLDHPMNWSNKDGAVNILILGSGTFRVQPQSNWQFYLREIQPCHSTTLELGANCNFGLTYVRQWDSSTVRLLADVTIANLNSTDAACRFDLNGKTLNLNGGERRWDNWNYSGQFVGTAGMIVYYGDDNFTVGASPAFTGEFRQYVGNLAFPAGVVFPTTVFPVVNGSSRFAFGSNQTLARISGDGNMGGIEMPDVAGSTLTLTGTGGVHEATTYNARLYGKDVVKTGADYTLTLTGDNCYSGTTTVAAGTLTLQRPISRPGLISCWTFDDPNDLGHDYGPTASHLSFYKIGTGVVTQRFDGVDGSLALGLGVTNVSRSTGCGYARSSAVRNHATEYPLGNDALSVTLWYKPNPGNSAGPGYVFRIGNWGSDGGQFVLWQRGETKMSWHIDNWDTADGEDSPQFACPDLCDGNWHFVGATYSNQTLKVYYDGQCVRTTTTTHPLAMTQYYVVLGNNDGQPNSTGSNHFIHGGYDDVCMWNRALSEEDVAAEYARRPVKDPAALLPKPLCHWTFDDNANIGKDSMGRANLVANPNTTQAVYTEARAGAFGRSLGWCSMALPQANQPADFPVGKASFTVSMRFLQASVSENVDLLRFGATNVVASGTASKYFRLWYLNCPRRLQLTCGSVSPRAFSRTGNYSSRKEGWSHVVVTADNLHGVLRVFRDGVLEATFTNFSVNLDPGDLYLNATKAAPGASVTGSYVDDLRIYDVALDPYQVQALGRSLETGKVGPVIPATSPVTVAAGACLRTGIGEMHTVKSVAGAGEVNVLGRLLVDDWSAFTGTVSGWGQLILGRNGGNVPVAAADNTANVIFEDDVVALSAANRTTPRVRTRGQVKLPATGTLKLVDANARAGSWFGQRLKIAECASYSGPTNTVGWTFDPAVDERDVAGKFFLQDGILYLKTRGEGTVLVFR